MAIYSRIIQAGAVVGGGASVIYAYASESDSVWKEISKVITEGWIEPITYGSARLGRGIMKIYLPKKLFKSWEDDYDSDFSNDIRDKVNALGGKGLVKKIGACKMTVEALMTSFKALVPKKMVGAASSGAKKAGFKYTFQWLEQAQRTVIWAARIHFWSARNGGPRPSSRVKSGSLALNSVCVRSTGYRAQIWFRYLAYLFRGFSLQNMFETGCIRNATNPKKFAPNLVKREWRTAVAYLIKAKAWELFADKASKRARMIYDLCSVAGRGLNLFKSSKK